MTDIPVLILSHKRAGRVTTHRFVANTRIVVPESQYVDYVKHHPKEQLIVHPDSVIGASWKRQWMYENFGSQFQLDDDVVSFFRLYREAGKGGMKRKASCTPERAYDVIQETAETARRMGAFIFGFGSHANPMTYNQFRPFKFGGYTPSGALGWLAGSKLFFPKGPTFPFLDYWICLLNAYHHRYAWYDCRFAFGFKTTYTGAGGMAEFRVGSYPGEREKQGTRFLVKHFGTVVQRKHNRSGNSGPTVMERNASPRTIRLPFKV